jgi:hypothetical protein
MSLYNIALFRNGEVDDFQIRQLDDPTFSQRLNDAIDKNSFPFSIDITYYRQMDGDFSASRVVVNADVMILTLDFKRDPTGQQLRLSRNIRYRILSQSEEVNGRSQVFPSREFLQYSVIQMYNLLCGRAILQETYLAHRLRWLALDLYERDADGNYKLAYCSDYNLFNVLNKYPILEAHCDETKKQLVTLLCIGNRVKVTLCRQRKKEPVYIEANPRFKLIKIYPILITKRVK